jgi:hypothetical protein
MRLIIAALTVAGAANASAGIVYTWETTALSNTIQSIGGTLELADALWPAGSVYHSNWSFCIDCPHRPSPPPELISFAFNVNGQTVMLYDGRQQGHLSMDLSVLGASTLIGSMYMNDTQSHVRMESSLGTLWTITDFRSDGPTTPDCYSSSCYGATGNWVLDRSSIPVPEPSTLTLVALPIGLAMLAKHRRRK